MDNDADLKDLIRTVIKEVHATSFPLSRDEASNIALAAAKEAVRQEHEHLFSHLGYDIANKDDVKRLRGNMDFLEMFHAGTSKASSHVVQVGIATTIGAFLYAVYLGFKVAFTGKAF